MASIVTHFRDSHHGQQWTYVTESEHMPMPAGFVHYNVKEIAFVQPKKARGKGRGRR